MKFSRAYLAPMLLLALGLPLLQLARAQVGPETAPATPSTDPNAVTPPVSTQVAALDYHDFTFLGERVRAGDINGAEYVPLDALESQLEVTRLGQIIRLEGYGHILFIPVDEDQMRSSTNFNTVQLDTSRVRLRAATLVGGVIHVPMDTVARGLGAEYQRGRVALEAPELRGVSSRQGESSDRLVLDLSRDVATSEQLYGSTLVVTLKGLSASAQRYTTQGPFISNVKVEPSGQDLRLSFQMLPTSGYRLYHVVRRNSSRIVIDAGPGIVAAAPALMERLARPLIVLDPARVPGMGRDVTLDVARRAAEALTKAGWQVKLTREQNIAMGLNQKLALVRQSDVYLALDMGQFPGAKRSGITVYEGTGRSSNEYVDALRADPSVPYANLAVGDNGGTRRLSELLRGELKVGGLEAGSADMSRMLTLSEAPQAGLILELGWLGSSDDQAKLGTEEHLSALSVAVARSVATYLTARNTNASTPPSTKESE